MTDFWKKRIVTTKYYETVGGIMLCGINWGGGGGAATEIGLTERRSFFSDVTTKNANYPFQSKIREWFKIWGYPLANDEPGPLERSISQTNWIAEASRHADGFYTQANLVQCAEEEFLPVLEAVSPRLLIFLGVQHLPGAFAHPRLREREQDLLGPLKSECESHWHDRVGGGRRFRATTMAFEHCFVLGLPHPTPKSWPLSNEDVANLSGLFRLAIESSGIRIGR